MKLINKYITLLLLGMAALSSCSYLDIVPDTKATFDDCFKSQAECKKFQMYLYQSMPSPGSWYSVPETYAGDDFISGRKGSVKYFQYKSLLYGLESPSQSYFGFWYTGTSDGMDNSRRTILEMYESIRHCYMFLSNIDRVPDITEENLRTWKGEAYFLIGFYHHMIFNYYGPCVLIEREISTNASPEELLLPRSTADKCAEFICRMYDTAAELLPAKRIEAELNLATAAAAKAYKASMLLTLASPLYNGNMDMVDFKNHDGTNLISTVYDKEKWARAMEAAKEAYEYCEANGYLLYDHKDNTISDEFARNVENYHDVFCKNHHNPEEYLIAYGGAYIAQQTIRHCAPRSSDPSGTGSYYADGWRGYYVPTFEAVEMYYTADGLPWDKDPKTRGINPYEYDPATGTAKMHAGREPRFYANVGYDRGTYDINGTTIEIHVRGGEEHGSALNVEPEYQNCTGYFNKKFINKKNRFDPTNKTFSYFEYNYPMMRLAELYLAYAEASFEYNGSLDGTALECLDKVRSRAGLPNFEASWKLAGGIPAGDELRQILHRERSIEFFCEGHRYFDLRRWKEAETVMVRKPKAWNLDGKTAEDFYQVSDMPELMERVWKSYWLAIPLQEMNINPNLVQNPGY